MTIEERVEKQERELAEIKDSLTAAKRRTRRLMAGAGVVLGMFVLFVVARAITGVVQGQAKEKVIRANMFLVEDDNGRTRARLGMSNIGTSLDLFDEQGICRALMNLSENGIALFLVDENDNTRVTLGVSKTVSGLVVWDEKHEPIWKAP